MIVHGNAAFVALFGDRCVGQPAREALIGLPVEAFELMDAVFLGGKALARRIETTWGARRLVVAARQDPETGQTYGVMTHLTPVTTVAPTG